MKRYPCCALMVSLVAVAAVPLCHGQEGAKAPLNADVKAVVEGNNEFAFDLYKRLSEKKGNIVFSPYSISTALAMTYAGARGDTAEKMAKALHFTLPQERFHPAFRDLIGDLQKEQKGGPFELNIANALWGQTGYPLGKEFVQIAQESYGGGLREIDFAADSEQARKAINLWVEEKTKDKIKALLAVGDVTRDTFFVLANAIYFKAKWKKPFPKDQTKDVAFESANGRQTSVPMMHLKQGPFRYMDADNFQWLELPYQGDRLSMLLLLPQKKGMLPELEKTLSASALEKGARNLGMRGGQVALPRFKMTESFGLLDLLVKMGMPYSPFDGIGPKFELQFVVHKAFIDLDETGTEAAAATGVGGGPGSYVPPFSFQADHPFLFLIRDTQTGSILFMGRVSDPR